ncbi:hypothetical protein PanWU01x14_118870, partial [Parasponia andersonii]
PSDASDDFIDPALAVTCSYNNPRRSKRVSEPSTLRKDYYDYFVLAILHEPYSFHEDSSNPSWQNEG